jgi:hypothetical protein
LPCVPLDSLPSLCWYAASCPSRLPICTALLCPALLTSAVCQKQVLCSTLGCPALACAQASQAHPLVPRFSSLLSIERIISPNGFPCPSSLLDVAVSLRQERACPSSRFTLPYLQTTAGLSHFLPDTIIRLHALRATEYCPAAPFRDTRHD